MIWGTLTYTDKGMIFETWDNYSDCILAAELAKRDGHRVTIFDYDSESKQYREYYTLE